MKKQFKPVIKHDVITQTYTIRDKKGVVIQVPDTLIDRLDSHYSKLEAQRTAYARSYKQVLEENEKLKEENEELKHQWDYLYESFAYLQEDYNDLERQYDELFRKYEMLNELI